MDLAVVGLGAAEPTAPTRTGRREGAEIMHVLLAGASGVLGGPLIRHLIDAGHRVTGIARSPAAADVVRSRGAEPLIADAMDREALLAAVRGLEFDAILHELTALKRAPLRHSGMAATDRLRTEGSAHLLEAARETGAGRFVTQSIVLGYGYRDHGVTPLTEDAPFGELHGDAFDPHVEAMASAERQATRAPDLQGVALRYGLFYGADTAATVAMLRRRSLPIVRHGGELPFVHHEDAAAATVAALERGRPGGVYNVVDDTPATFSDLLTRTAEAAGAPRPPVFPWWLLSLVAPYAKVMYRGVSMRVSNALAGTELGWRPRHPSIAEGIAA